MLVLKIFKVLFESIIIYDTFYYCYCQIASACIVTLYIHSNFITARADTIARAYDNSFLKGFSRVLWKNNYPGKIKNARMTSLARVYRTFERAIFHLIIFLKIYKGGEIQHC